jgi:hypothetical protein
MRLPPPVQRHAVAAEMPTNSSHPTSATRKLDFNKVLALILVLLIMIIMTIYCSFDDSLIWSPREEPSSIKCDVPIISTTTGELVSNITTTLPNRTRYFGIGANKSGTSSLHKALLSLGLVVASQSQYERLLPHWINRNFKPIIDQVQADGSDAFQDVPFSLGFTYQVLDFTFPGSKFILTERSSADVWFESIRNYHGKMFNRTKMTSSNSTKWNTPTISDLKNAGYIYRGWIYSFIKSVFDLPNDDDAASKLIYNKDHFIRYYEWHNQAVKLYFSSRPDDLLVLNVENNDAMERLCYFVGKPCPGQTFPHQNQT